MSLYIQNAITVQAKFRDEEQGEIRELSRECGVFCERESTESSDEYLSEL